MEVSQRETGCGAKLVSVMGGSSALLQRKVRM